MVINTHRLLIFLFVLIISYNLFTQFKTYFNPITLYFYKHVLHVIRTRNQCNLSHYAISPTLLDDPTVFQYVSLSFNSSLYISSFCVVIRIFMCCYLHISLLFSVCFCVILLVVLGYYSIFVYFCVVLCVFLCYSPYISVLFSAYFWAYSPYIYELFTDSCVTISVLFFIYLTIESC